MTNFFYTFAHLKRRFYIIFSNNIKVPIPVEITEKKHPTNYCGIDPGIKTFMTCFGNNGCIEHKYNEKMIKDLDNKINLLKDRRRTNRNRVNKKKMNRIEIRKVRNCSLSVYKYSQTFINCYKNGRNRPFLTTSKKIDLDF